MRTSLFVALALFATVSAAKEPLPAGTIQKGSLANQKLIHDAMLGVVGRAATLGCNKIDAFQPYVVAMPEGTPGARVWHERWIVTCAGVDYPINIRFNESGPDAADWSTE